MRCLAGLAFLALSAVPLAQAKDDPVQWSLALANGARQLAPGSTVTLDLKATIQPGWHLYSPTTPPGGPIITKIRLNPNPNVASYQVYRPQPVRKLDPNFNIDTETYTRDAIS